MQFFSLPKTILSPSRDNLTPFKKAPSQASKPTSRLINFCLLNTWSVKHKVMNLKDFVVDHDIDILAITETWLRPGNIDEVDIGTLCPTGYRFFSCSEIILSRRRSWLIIQRNNKCKHPDH